MSITYTPTTNFAGKDGLPANDSNKVVKGAEFTTEFSAIQSAFALAAPSSNPTITGTATFDDVSVGGDLSVTGAFTSLGIDDNATSTAITIDANENVGIGGAPVSGARQLMVKGATDARVDVRSGSDTNVGAIDFSDTSNTARGQFVYDHNDDSMQFATLSSERMRISSAGNVGIGTDAPAAQLEVKGSNTSARFRGAGSQLINFNFSESPSYAEMDVRNAGDFHIAKQGIKALTIDTDGNVGINNTNPAYALSARANSDANIAEFRNIDGGDNHGLTIQDGAGSIDINAVYSTNVPDLTFSTKNTERMRIDSSGYVGIGAAAPAQLLHLKDNDPALRLEDDEGGAARTYDVGSVGGNFVVKNVSQATQPLTILDSGNVGIGTASPSEKLAVVGSGAATSAYIYDGTGSTAARLTADGDNIDLSARGSASSNLTFTTGAGAGSEAVRIDSSGNLLVGRTASGGGADDGHTLYGTGAIYSSLGGTASTNQYRFYRNGSIVGSINTSGTGTSYVETSDERVKENIVDAPAGNIDDIKVRSFDFKNGSGHVTYGFIAQELHEVAPQAVAVGETDEDMWGVDYSKLVPMLVKEIQDLKAEVAALKGA